MEFKHVTVLRREMISAILTDKNGVYADCTLGGAGHLSLLSEKVENGALLIGIDQDLDALKAAELRMKDCTCNLNFVHSNFSNIKNILSEKNLNQINGFIFDLGVSSYQLDEANRGFSYMHEGRLDMRMNQNSELTAHDVVNKYSEEKIAFIIKEYGEERWAKRIAEFIVDYRKNKIIETTGELVSIIKAAIPLGGNSELTAHDVVNKYSEEKIAFIIKEYGEERWAKRIAEFIVDYRKNKIIETTGELVSIIKAAIPLGARKNGPHPAKRTFQAIRIEVNNELGIIESTINDCVDCLVSGGRIGIITFHSLEDRIVKRTFKNLAKQCICPPEFPLCVCNHQRKIKLLGNGIRPTDEEIAENPRARSAILRVAEKI